LAHLADRGRSRRWGTDAPALGALHGSAARRQASPPLPQVLVRHVRRAARFAALLRMRPHREARIEAAQIPPPMALGERWIHVRAHAAAGLHGSRRSRTRLVLAAAEVQN